MFGLGEVNWVQGHLDFTGITSNGGSPVTSGTMDAVRIIPDANESLNSVQILTYSTTQTANYNSGDLTVGIWSSSSDGSDPLSPLQQINVSTTEVPANGILKVSGFSQQVTAGDAYWLVFSTNSNQIITFARLTSTYAYLVLASSDEGSKWTPLLDGPTEFAFVATLSEQSLGNYIAGFPNVSLSPASDFAQPFYAASTCQVDGVFIGPLRGGAYLQVSIVPTTAKGTPSSTALATVVYNANEITLDYGLEFVQLSSVARLQAGTEYWILIHPLNSTYELSPVAYLPGAPGVPANMSTMVSSDGGSSWRDVTNGTSMLSYELTTPAVPLPDLTAQQAFADLTANENHSVDSGVLQGWNAYIQTYELSLFNQAATWLSTNTSRQFEFTTEANPNVLSQVAHPGVVALTAPSPGLSCPTLLNEVESELPLTGAQYYNVGTSASLTNCGAAASSLAITLNSVKYTGNYFGTGDGEPVLIVGDAQTSNLTRYLSVAYNASYAQLSLDPLLQHEGTLTRFAAIVWTSQDAVTSSPSLESSLLQYVQRGGMLIITNETSASSGLSTILGAFPPPPVDTPMDQPAGKFLQESVSHSTYAGSLSLSIVSNTSASVSSTGLSLSAEDYGLGRLVIASFGETIHQSSERVALLAGLIAVDMNESAPFWYGMPSSSISFGIYGEKGGPILVWLANPTSTSSTILLDLNSTFYGVSGPWTLVDLNSIATFAGSGNDIQINSTLPPFSMQPVFVVPLNQVLAMEYSNVVVARQLTYPDQSLFTLTGATGQVVLAFIRSNSTIGQVLLNDKTVLPEVQSVAAVQKASAGWFFDSGSNSLLVKYTTNGTDTLRVLLSRPTPPATPVLPLGNYEMAVGLLVLAEFTVLAYFTVSRRRRRGPGLRLESEQQQHHH